MIPRNAIPMEETMRKQLMTTSAAFAILTIGSVMSFSAQAAPTATRAAITADSDIVAVHYVHSVRHHRHHVAVQSESEITNFSSSSLHVGVNHPAKK
jgi:hypothetical protein